MLLLLLLPLPSEPLPTAEIRPPEGPDWAGLVAIPVEVVATVIDDDTAGALLEEEEEVETAVDTMVGNPMSSLKICDCPSFSMFPPKRQTESASKQKALRRTSTLRNAILLPLLMM